MINILIVEDEQPISNLIRVNLTESGYCCDIADDGMQAADMIEQNRYDLILLDIMLPKVNGYELMEYIAPTGTPVIFITAKNDVADRVKASTSERMIISSSPLKLSNCLRVSRQFCAGIIREKTKFP